MLTFRSDHARLLFPLPITADIVILAVGDTKKCVFEVFWELEKTLAQVYYIWGGYFEGDKIVSY